MTTPITFTDSTARRLESMYATGDARRRRAAAIAALSPQPGERILDIGTGLGLLAHEMADRVGARGQIIGVDLATSMLALARRRCAPVPWIDLREGDATALPVDDASIDGALSVQVFEYVEDADRALAEAFRVLRPGGRIVIVSTDWPTLLWHSHDPARMELVRKAWEAHCAHATLPRTLASRLRRAGFAVGAQEVLPQFNPVWHADTFSGHLLGMIERFVAAAPGIGPDLARAWAGEQHRLASDGEYFFCLNQYLCVATRP